MKDYIILDTDIGDDIDDAFALGYLLTEDINFAAITTVFRNTKARAYQAKELVKAYGKEVDVYYGEGMPLSKEIPGFPFDNGDPLLSNPPQFDEEMMKYEIKENAVDAIIELAKKYKHNLVIFTIGAMTNVAKAIIKAPEIKNYIKCIYQMGGDFETFRPEWNILCDPKAVDIVYKSMIPVKAVGLNVTLKCSVDKSLLDSLYNSEKKETKLIIKWMKRWFEAFHFEKSVLHDPLAISSYFFDVVTFEDSYVKVIQDGEKKGSIYFSKEPFEDSVKISIATSVDRDKFIKVFARKFI